MDTVLSVYDPVQTLAAIDANRQFITSCLLFATPFTFVYFFVGIRMAVRQRFYAVPFLGCALFVWHDGYYVTLWQHWTDAYQFHWWLAQWTYAQIGTVALEAFLIWQFIKYGRREIMPDASPALFATLSILCTLGIGVVFWYVKSAMADELYLVTQCLTAAFPAAPCHTGMLIRRRSRAGSSIAMQISLMLVHGSMCAAAMCCWWTTSSTPARRFTG